MEYSFVASSKCAILQIYPVPCGIMAKRRRNDDGMVFSTSSSFSWDVEDSTEDEDWSSSDCLLYVSLDRKNRGGKPVTFIEGFDGPSMQLLILGKDLKKMCGVGGSVKDGYILIQGDHRDKVVARLEKDGFRVKRKGG